MLTELAPEILRRIAYFVTRDGGTVHPGRVVGLVVSCRLMYRELCLFMWAVVPLTVKRRGGQSLTLGPLHLQIIWFKPWLVERVLALNVFDDTSYYVRTADVVYGRLLARTLPLFGNLTLMAVSTSRVATFGTLMKLSPHLESVRVYIQFLHLKAVADSEFTQLFLVAYHRRAPMRLRCFNVTCSQVVVPMSGWRGNAIQYKQLHVMLALVIDKFRGLLRSVHLHNIDAAALHHHMPVMDRPFPHLGLLIMNQTSVLGLTTWLRVFQHASPAVLLVVHDTTTNTMRTTLAGQHRPYAQWVRFQNPEAKVRWIKARFGVD